PGVVHPRQLLPDPLGCLVVDRAPGLDRPADLVEPPRFFPGPGDPHLHGRLDVGRARVLAVVDLPDHVLDGRAVGRDHGSIALLTASVGGTLDQLPLPIADRPFGLAPVLTPRLAIVASATLADG